MYLIFNDDGKGAIGPGYFLWKQGPSNQITLTGSFSGNPKKSDSVTVVFDSDKRVVKFPDKELDHGKSLFHGATFFYKTNGIPKSLHNRLLHFDGTTWSLTHGCVDTVFAIGVTNHFKDLRKIEGAIQPEGLYCYFGTSIAGDKMNFIGVDVRDINLAREYCTNLIAHDSLSVKIRKSADSNIFETWESGKKQGEEQFENGKPVYTWGRP